MNNKHGSLFNILFLDIETVSAEKDFQGLSSAMQKHWKHKAQFIPNKDKVAVEELYFDRAGIYAEFGKIITIGIAYFLEGEGELTLRVGALKGDNEKQLLIEFKELINRFKKSNELRLCAHNGKEFDFPYICRRMLVNQISLPKTLDLRGKKPWQITHYDTMELWKFGDIKNFSSLDLLASVFGLHSSKSDMDGSMVNTVYHRENGLDRIAEYCIEDVIVLVRLFLKYLLKPDLADNSIIRM